MPTSMPDKAVPGSVPPSLYDERYFLGSCGGSEIFRRYGASVLKPNMADLLLRAEIRPGLRVLDVGCGRGELLHRLQRLGARPVGCDFSESALRIASRTAPEVPLWRCDAKTLPFEDGSFDRVIVRGVFEHLHPWEQERCVGEALRVLAPGGLLVLDTCTNRLYYKTLTYRLRLRLAGLLRAAGLAVRPPSEPRSCEDLALHVSEQSYFSLRRFFRELSLEAGVEPRPNPKLRVRELYGEGALPPDFPMSPTPEWRRRLYLRLLFHRPMSWFLARSFACTVRRPG